MTFDEDPRDWDEQGNWIGEHPEFELKEPKVFTEDLLSEKLPTHWLIETPKFDDHRVSFSGPPNAPFLSILRIRSSTTNSEVCIYHEYPSLTDGRQELSEPLVTKRFETLPEAVSAVEEAIFKYENN